MPTGLEEIALAFELSLETQQAGSFTKDIIKSALDETALSLLAKFEDFASKRTVLFDTDPERLEDGQAVFFSYHRSPRAILRARQATRFPSFAYWKNLRYLRSV